jgi:hypothetical protein
VKAIGPTTNMVLDQVMADDDYTYRVGVVTYDDTRDPKVQTTYSVPATVSVSARQATTRIAESFNANTLDPNVWIVSDPQANWKIDSGGGVLNPGVAMNIGLSSFKLSANGLELVARVKVDGSFDDKSKKDQIAASIGFESTAPDGYNLKLCMHDQCGKRQFDLQYTKKVLVDSQSKPNVPIPIPTLNAKKSWVVGTYYWLKLKIDRQAGTATAWEWPNDTTVDPKADDDKEKVAFYQLKPALKSLEINPFLYADVGTANFGEVIVEDLNPPPAATAAACKQPTAPVCTPGSTQCLVAEFVRGSARLPLVPPDLDCPIRAPIVALAPWNIGHRGTLIGRVEPQPPIRVACLEPICPWKVPTAATTTCCASSSLAAGSGAVSTIPLDGVYLDGGYVDGVPGAEWLPEGARDFSTPFVMPTQNPITPALPPAVDLRATPEGGVPELLAPLNAASRASRRDLSLRRSSFRAPDENSTIGEQGATASPHVGSSAGDQATQVAPRAALRLPQTIMTRRGLRDYGAVATVPDPPKQPLTQEQKAIGDTLVIQLIKHPAKPFASKEPKDVLQQVRADVGAACWPRDVTTLVLTRMCQYEQEGLPKAVADEINQIKPTAQARAPLPMAPSEGTAFPNLGLFAPPYLPGGGTRAETDRQPRDPFWCLPTVRVVELCQATADQAGSAQPAGVGFRRTHPVDDLTDTADSRVWTYHFDHPARFPISRLGLNCCAFEGEGAVIHEGMRLLAGQDGNYELRFNITGPSIPIQIRLQLILFEECRSPDAPIQSIPRTLTLPLIVVQPEGPEAFPNDLEGGIHPTSYIVSVRGYSQVIREVQGDENGPGHFLLVQRSGTARIGSGVQYQTTP